jgi:hypothetical protein
MRRRVLDKRGNRLILVHWLGAAIVSFLATFTIVYVLEPEGFMLLLVTTIVPVAITSSFITHLVKSLDDAEEQ